MRVREKNSVDLYETFDMIVCTKERTMTRLIHMAAHRSASPPEGGTSRLDWCVRFTRVVVLGGHAAANLDPSASSGVAM